jgi:Uma2 family endonuclease
VVSFHVAMLVLEPSVRPSAVPRHRYRRPPEPVYFPDSEEVPESKYHLERRTALYQSLKREAASSATIGSDQFVYWDPTTSKKRLAPDAFVRLGVADQPFTSWKIWERGAPDLAVEIVSDSDAPEPDWNQKLVRYRAAGIGEVVRFEPENGKHPIRVWDAIDGDLLERAPDDPDLHACEALGLWWTVVEHPTIGRMLRLARDREGRDLVPTPDEETAQARHESARAREAEAQAREAEAQARKANELLEAEVAALRAKLGGARGKRRPR